MSMHTDLLDRLGDVTPLCRVGSELDVGVLGSVAAGVDFSCFRGPMELNRRTKETSLEERSILYGNAVSCNTERGRK